MTLLLTAASTSFAGEYRGFSCKLEKAVGFRLIGQDVCSPVLFKTSIVRNDYIALQPGDGVLIQGTFDSVRNRFEIESVESVGLQRILGTWKDKKSSRYYRFISFNDLMIFDHNRIRPQKFVTFEYELYPNDRQSWLLILSNKSLLKGGYLRENSETSLELCLYEDRQHAKECVTLIWVSQ